MFNKKLRLDIISEDETKKIILAEICKIEENVHKMLASKEREILENKLEFSVVAKENTAVKEQLVKSEGELGKKEIELDECYKTR